MLTLKLSVLDIGRVGKNKQLIGHVILPLSELEGTAPDEEPQLYKLDIEKVRKFSKISLKERKMKKWKAKVMR